MLTAQQTSRFWSNVDRRGPDDCWEWQLSLRHGGYGQLTVAGKVRKAHHVSWEIAGRARTPGLEIRHRCDNARCVNPAHLIEGTHQQNMMDRVRSGRAAHKITPDDVLAIVAAWHGGASMRGLAREYGVTHRTISLICHGKAHGYWQARQEIAQSIAPHTGLPAD